MDSLFPLLSVEFQTQALTIYIMTFKTLEEVLQKVSF